MLALIGALAVSSSACTTTSDDVGEPSEVVTQESAATAAGPSAAEVMAKLATCNRVSSAPFAKDAGGAASLHVCGLANAVFFTADMDIDCDGKSTSVCNKSADASYQSSTAASDSHGQPLDASTLPYIVVPGVSSRWSYKAAGIKMGSVAAVLYNGKIEYGIVGDIGPQAILGEASYAMAQRLGINPNPSTGGVASGVTYVIFGGSGPTKNEDHAAAVSIGVARAQQLVDQD